MRNWSRCALLAFLLGVYGCGGGDAPPADDGAPANETTSSSEAAPSSEEHTSNQTAATGAGMNAPGGDNSTLSLIPEDAVAAIIARPSKVLGNPLVAEVMKMVSEANPQADLETGFAEMEKNSGIRPEQIDHVLLIVDQGFVDNLPLIAQMGPTAAAPIMVMQLNPGTSAQTVLDRLKASDTRGVSQPVTVGAYQGMTSPDGGNILKINDQRLLYIKDTSKLDALLNNSTQGKVATMLAGSATGDLTIVLDLEPVKQQAQQALQQNPQVAFAVMPLLTQMLTISIAADLEADNLLQVQVDTPNADAATGVKESLNLQLNAGKQQYAQMAGQVPPPFQPMLKQVVDGTNLASEGTVVSLTVPRPDDLEKLPALLIPAMMQARKAASNAVQKNNLKQIALAFHNYHDVYRHFPGLDSNGSKDEGNIRGKGLSWRVHLLPFLDEAALYDQFNLDEPWDSEQNKSLLPFMPSVYGDDFEGNTTIHVFAGENLLFAEGKPGAQFREILDGTSNTLLFVNAGEDTASPWTKPGGLELNADDPVSVLGQVGDVFSAALCDGSVRDISKAVDAETLKNLIQPGDGNPVFLP